MSSTIAFRLRGQATESLELDLYEAIGSDPLFGGGVGAGDVLSALNAQPKAKKILVRINSAGGIVIDGLAIYNLLRQSKAQVTCRVDGMAGSIASVIAMAGTLEMAANSWLMIHNPFGWIEGGSEELRRQADVLDGMRSQMLDIYCAKSGRSRDVIGALMDDETWLSPSMALAYGLCDRIVPEGNERLAAHFDLSRFRNTPRAIDPARNSAGSSMTIPTDGDPAIAGSAEEALRALSQSPATFQNNVTLGSAASDEVTVTDPPAAQPAAPGATPMDEQVYKDQIAALEAQVAELKAALDGANTARAQAEAATIEAKAKKAKGEDDDEDEDDEEMAAVKSVVAEAQELTGCKDVKKLRGALMGYADRLKNEKTTQTVTERVEALFKAGKIRPGVKAKALKMTHAELDGYIEMIGDARVGPVGTEHEPNDEAPEVIAARAAATPPAKAFDPAKITLDADELKMCKVRDPHGTDGFQARYLADKVARAKAQFEARA